MRSLYKIKSPETHDTPTNWNSVSQLHCVGLSRSVTRGFQTFRVLCLIPCQATNETHLHNVIQHPNQYLSTRSRYVSVLRLFSNFCLVPTPCPTAQASLTTASDVHPQIHHPWQTTKSFFLFDHPLRNSYALLSAFTACWALFTTIMVPSLFLLILPAVGYALSTIFSLRLALLLSMMRSVMYSYGIGWITSTFPLEIGDVRTSLICSTVRSCTRSCGMIFTVSVVPSLTWGTRTPTIFVNDEHSTLLDGHQLNHVHSIVNHLWHWNVHNLFHDAFRDSFLHHLTQDVYLIHNLFYNASDLFYNASVHEFQSLEYRDVNEFFEDSFLNPFFGHQPIRLRVFALFWGWVTHVDMQSFAWSS